MTIRATEYGLRAGSSGFWNWNSKWVPVDAPGIVVVYVKLPVWRGPAAPAVGAAPSAMAPSATTAAELQVNRPISPVPARGYTGIGLPERRSGAGGATARPA